MITITSNLFDPQGVLTVDPLPDSDLGEISRRVTRVQTLDLGAAFNNQGFSHADRTFRIVWRLTDATHATARYLVENHDAVTVSTNQGVFSGFLERYTPTATQGEIIILISDRAGP